MVLLFEYIENSLSLEVQRKLITVVCKNLLFLSACVLVKQIRLRHLMS